MGVMDRLLLREILKTLLVVLLVLALILLSNTLVRYLGMAASGALGTDILLIVVGLELVKALGLIIPPAFFFSVMWVLGRMYRDSEMVALAASGFGYTRIFRSVFLAAVPLAVLVAILVMAATSSRIDATSSSKASKLVAMEGNSSDSCV